MSEDMAGLNRKLNLLFWGLTLPAAAFLAAGYLLHRMELAVSPPAGALRAWGIGLLIAAVTLGAALPVLLRTLFNRAAMRAGKVEPGEFAAHQKRLVAVAVSSAYVAGLSYLLLVPPLYLYGSVLAGLYGIYSAIPSERKLKAEKKFYGVGGK
jgi:hypothetical protein